MFQIRSPREQESGCHVLVRHITSGCQSYKQGRPWSGPKPGKCTTDGYNENVSEGLEQGQQGPFKDTNERRGHDGQNGPCWDGLLGVFEVPRAVGSCHDPCRTDRRDSD